jgi:hypothetical protein
MSKKSKVIMQTYDENGKPSSTFFDDGMDIINFAEKIDYEQMYERALDEMEKLINRIQELESELDRVRYQTINQNYILGGRG